MLSWTSRRNRNVDLVARTRKAAMNKSTLAADWIAALVKRGLERDDATALVTYAIAKAVIDLREQEPS